jgi:hypothetical protein
MVNAKRKHQRGTRHTLSPTGTSYQYTEVKNGGQTGSASIQVSLDNGLPVVTFNQSKLPVDTATATHRYLRR